MCLRRPPAAIILCPVPDPHPAPRSRFALGTATLVLAASIGSAPGADLGDLARFFEDPIALTSDSRAVVCIVDTQHPDTIREKVTGGGGYEYMDKLRRIATELSGLPCVAVHCTQVATAACIGPCVKAMWITARSRKIDEACDARLFALIREIRVPAIGFCGGCQLIAQAYGASVRPMRPLKPGEPDPHPAYMPGQYKEWGFLPVQIVRRDPLLAGLADPIVVKQMHGWEIKSLPPVFDVLGRTDECAFEVIRHKARPLYGTQFHAEHYDDVHPDGKTILRNFFAVALGPRRGARP